jgi:hypothetical protein
MHSLSHLMDILIMTTDFVFVNSGVCRWNMDRNRIHSGAVICVVTLADEATSARSELISFRIAVAHLYSDSTTG